MNPIFFPTTYIPQADRHLLLACFRHVTVLQPSGKLLPSALSHLEKTCRIDLRFPDESPDGEFEEEAVDSLPNLLNAYHAWAELHQGEPPDFRKFARFAPAPPDDLSTEWIRDQIRHHKGKETRRPGSSTALDPLLMARLFLAIGQEYDQQHESLSNDLDAIGAMEKNMFQDLSPDQPSPPFTATGDPVQARFKTERSIPPEQKLTAWCHLYTHCLGAATTPATSPPAFFITNDQDALHLVLDSVETLETVCQIEKIPLVQEEGAFVSTTVHRKIDTLLQSALRVAPPSPPSVFSLANEVVSTCGTGKIVIYRIKGSPMTPINSGPGNLTGPAEKKETDGESHFTLLGHIERNCVLDSPNQLV